MRFSHRPCVADTFCGSGQIPFEAARLGCDVYASDLNPVGCMLTWGAFDIVGGSVKSRQKLATDQQELARRVQAEIDQLSVEDDGDGGRRRRLAGQGVSLLRLKHGVHRRSGWFRYCQRGW